MLFVDVRNYCIYHKCAYRRFDIFCCEIVDIPFRIFTFGEFNVIREHDQNINLATL